jgi:hypothetical protein
VATAVQKDFGLKHHNSRILRRCCMYDHISRRYCCAARRPSSGCCDDGLPAYYTQGCGVAVSASGRFELTRCVHPPRPIDAEDDVVVVEVGVLPSECLGVKRRRDRSVVRVVVWPVRSVPSRVRGSHRSAVARRFVSHSP